MLAFSIQTADKKCFYLGNMCHISNLALQHLIQHHLLSELVGCFWGLRRLSLVDLDGIFCSETSMCLLGPRSGCMCSAVILAFSSLGCSCIRVAGTPLSPCIPLHTSTNGNLQPVQGAGRQSQIVRGITVRVDQAAQPSHWAATILPAQAVVTKQCRSCVERIMGF